MLRRKDEASPLLKHWMEIHPTRENPPEFTFKVIGTHQSALERQLKEGLAIARDRSDFPLNNKMEFGRNSIILHQATYEGKPQIIPSTQSTPSTPATPVEDSKEREEEPKRKRRREMESIREEEEESMIQPPAARGRM